MSDGQTPQDRLPDHPGEPVAGAPEDVSSASASANQGPSSEPLTGTPRSRGRRAPKPADAGVVSSSTAASAAVSVVSAAMAATAAGKARAKAKPSVTDGGNVRPPGPEVPDLIRASRDEPEDGLADEEADDLAISPLVPLPPLSVADDSNRRYMRPVPDVPGIIRASREEEALAEDLAKAAPIFSNEGIVRAAAARRRNRVLAPIADLGGAFLDAGSALGHGIVSNIPGAKVAAASPDASARVASPDFDKYGNPRRSAGNRRALALVGIAGLIIAVLAASYMFLPGPDLNGFPLIPNSSNDTKDVIGDRTADPDDPDGIAIGDASSGPNGGGRKPSPSMTYYLPWCDEVMPTPIPTPTPSPAPTASSSTSPTPTPTPTPKPSPTPCRTRAPAATHSTGPTGSASATPTATPTPSPSPTPVVMFAYLWETVLNDGGNPQFHVQSLPGALCHLTRTGGVNSGSFTTATSGTAAGWAKVTWTGWTATGLITVYATCSMSGGPPYPSNSVEFTWPLPTPTPPPATPPPPSGS
jgi:hypothetical protein